MKILPIAIISMMSIPIAITAVNILASVVKKDRYVALVGPIPVVITPKVIGPGEFMLSVSPVFPMDLLFEGFNYSVSPRNGVRMSVSEAAKEAAKIASTMWL